jgi:hypothetical protein
VGEEQPGPIAAAALRPHLSVVLLQAESGDIRAAVDDLRKFWLATARVES